MTLNAYDTFLLNGMVSTSIRHFSAKYFEITPPTLSVSASLLNPPSMLTFKLTKKISKYNLAPKLRLVYTNFFVIILLNVLIPCSKNCSPTSLLDVLHTSLIISLKKALIINQFNQLLHLFLHFVLMIRPIFLKYSSVYSF